LTEDTGLAKMVQVPKPTDDDPNTTDKERNPAKYYYQYMLDACEKLFDAEIDQNTFEEQLRFMFGTKAYLLFTVDKVISALIKQVCAQMSVWKRRN
jgi:histone deacetylase complex regulatory component SIN3